MPTLRHLAGGLMAALIPGLSGPKQVWTREDANQQGKTPKQAVAGPDFVELAGGIVHDFNNLLHPIIGYTQMTISGMPEGSMARNNLEAVLKAAGRARDLVQKFLIFGLNGHTQPTPLKIQGVISEALTFLRASQPNTIKIHWNTGRECGMVLADPTQMHRVIMNLCTNACHAMQETGGVLKVDLAEVDMGPDHSNGRDLAPGKYVCITVRDTGQGIDSAVMEHIFNPFFTTKQGGQGAGLGLFIAIGIVRGYGGNIHITSEQGKGTQVDVYMPRMEC